MRLFGRSLIALLALAAAAPARAVPTPDPVFTFREREDNDLCPSAQVVDASDAVLATGEELVRDCFFITGKLQRDCIWDIQPKCSLRIYGKHQQCYSPTGQLMLGHHYEPLLAGANNGPILGFVVSPTDRVVRLAVAASIDALDGTPNGLNQNTPHAEKGEVTVGVHYDGAASPAQTAVFHFVSGAEAFRVSFVIPLGVASVDIQCDNATGQFPVCYDVDFYKIRNLIPNRSYCVTVVGGLDDRCEKVDSLVGWFDKKWILLNAADGGGQSGTPWPRLCIVSDGDGNICLGVTGAGDWTFNGLKDASEMDFLDFLRFTLPLIEGIHVEFRPGASVKDETIGDVIRYPRQIWDRYFPGPIPPEVAVQHGVCGEYCLKIRLAEHVDPSARPTPGPPSMSPFRADVNSDGVVSSMDLAILLSLWGAVPPAQ